MQSCFSCCLFTFSCCFWNGDPFVSEEAWVIRRELAFFLLFFEIAWSLITLLIAGNLAECRQVQLTWELSRFFDTVNPEYFVHTQFSYPGLSDLSYAWNFRTVADRCRFSGMLCTFRMHFIFVRKAARTKYTKITCIRNILDLQYVKRSAMFLSSTCDAIVKKKKKEKKKKDCPSHERWLIMTDMAFSLLEIQEMVCFVFQPLSLIVGASLSEPHQTSCWPSSLAAIFDRCRTFNFWSALISVEPAPAARILCLHVTLLVLPACACTLACLVPHIWAACIGRTSGAGLDDMHCSRNHARSCTCRDVCTGIQTCLKYMFMYMKLGLQCRISSCRTAAPSLGKVSMHALASALRLHGCALACHVCLLYWKYRLWFMYIHELYSAEYRCMVKVCAPCVGQRRIDMYITKMTRTRANSTSLVCIAFLLSVVSWAAQERQKAFCSGSPQNALHCLVRRNPYAPVRRYNNYFYKIR